MELPRLSLPLYWTSIEAETLLSLFFFFSYPREIGVGANIEFVLSEPRSSFFSSAGRGRFGRPNFPSLSSFLTLEERERERGEGRRHEIYKWRARRPLRSNHSSFGMQSTCTGCGCRSVSGRKLSAKGKIAGKRAWSDLEGSCGFVEGGMERRGGKRIEREGERRRGQREKEKKSKRKKDGGVDGGVLAVA